MRSHLDLDMIRRIAEAGADGRFLFVNTTNLDYAASRPFDLVAEARHALSRANSIVFTISHSRRPESPPHFRSA